MANPLSFTFYTNPGISDLRAQFFDSVGTNSGAAISTGFIERGTNGMYIFFGDPGDNFTGGVEFYSLADPTNILAIRDISPKEVENNDVKASTLATQTSVNTIDDLLDTEIAAIQSALAALNNLSAADVNAQVLDVLATDMFAEPSAPPAATASIKDKIGWVAAVLRNKLTQTATTQTLFADDGSTVVATSTTADDGVTFSRSEFV